MSVSDDEDSDKSPTIMVRQRSYSDSSSSAKQLEIISAWRPCVSLLQQPSMVNFCKLRRCIGQSNGHSMEEFLRYDGLELLFECLNNLTYCNGRLANLVLRAECVMCIRTVMNSELGLSFLIQKNCGDSFGKGNIASVFSFFYASPIFVFIHTKGYSLVWFHNLAKYFGTILYFTLTLHWQLFAHGPKTFLTIWK